jgi:pimeloyl-ACP methyl ester carboxylesterase
MENTLQANELRTLQLDSPKVNYVQQGTGEPVILTHGLAASLHDWDDLLPELAASGYAGYALDLFGHGESDKPKDHHQYTFDRVFHDFSAWIDSLKLGEPFILVGHSLGGALSLHYALIHPEQVRALVLVNPFYEMPQLPLIMQAFYKYQLINTHLIDLAPYPVFRAIVNVSSTHTHSATGETHVIPEHIRYQTALDYKRASSGIYNIPRTIPVLTPNLSNIRIPTQLIWGGCDQTLAPESFPRLGEFLPNLVSKHVMPICGHVPHQCHPKTFNPYFMEFLKTLA